MSSVTPCIAVCSAIDSNFDCCRKEAVNDSKSLLSEHQRRGGGYRTDLEAVDQVIPFIHINQQYPTTEDIKDPDYLDNFVRRHRECKKRHLRPVDSENLMLMFWHLWYPTMPGTGDALDGLFPDSKPMVPAPPLPPEAQKNLLEVLKELEKQYYQPKPADLSLPDDWDPLWCSLYVTTARAFALKRSQVITVMTAKSCYPRHWLLGFDS